MFKDKDGNFCLAKTSFAGTLSAFLIMIIENAFRDIPRDLDYTGMAMFLGVVGTVYFSRSHTKSVEKQNVAS